MAKRARTDIHRPAAIVPGEYEHVVSYHLATSMDGWPIPPFNVDVVMELLRTEKFASTGGLGNCSVCGACFIHGEVWVHEPTGEHIYIGHDCAAKYGMLADRSAYELQADRARATAIALGVKGRKAREREVFLERYPGLAEDLKVEHRIIADIAARFVEFCALTPGQIALVQKLANEVRNPPPPKPEEAKVAAPVGRHTFEGTVVSAKLHENEYGSTWKLTVKVATPEGVWLAWTTCPAGVLEDFHKDCDSYPDARTLLRGAVVCITATLTAGKEPHFAFGKRPHGKLVKRSEAQELVLAQEAAQRAADALEDACQVDPFAEFAPTTFASAQVDARGN